MDNEAVLVVDDEQPILDLVHDILEAYGYIVMCAISGKDALTVFEQNDSRIVLLLTDVRMPVMSGIELAERLRRKRPELPIVLMSATDQPASCPFLQKPFLPSQLLSCIRETLRHVCQSERERLPRIHLKAG